MYIKPKSNCYLYNKKTFSQDIDLKYPSFQKKVKILSRLGVI